MPARSRILVGRRACDDGFDVSDGVRRRRSAAWDNASPVESVIAACMISKRGARFGAFVRVDCVSQHPAPALSDDGRYALVGSPSAPLVRLLLWSP
jgi:hypothetical protein